VKECIIDNVTGHIGNINVLDKKIIDTLYDDNKLVTMSRSTIQLVEKKYNIENAVKRYLSVWSE
ncbi:MAG: glycosyltransferase, partial [Candidatus Hodarchaeota archaeon]